MRLNLKYLALMLAVMSIAACKSGVNGLDDDPQIDPRADFTFGSISNPSTLALGESITFSVYYQDEMLELSGCQIEKSDGSAFTGDEGGTITSTDTTCTYTAPSTLPASGTGLNIVAEIADSSPSLEATLGIVLDAEEPELCDAENATLAYWQNWISCDSPGDQEASYEWWMALVQEDGTSAEEAESIITCLVQTLCATDPQLAKGSCLSMDFIESNGEACIPQEDRSCHGDYVPSGCIGVDMDACENSYGIADYGPGRRFYNCGWNEDLGSCIFQGSPEEPEGCTGGSVSGPPPSTDITGTYVWDGETRSNDACDFDLPTVGMYDPDDTQLEWMGWGADVYAFQFNGDSLTYAWHVYNEDTGIIAVPDFPGGAQTGVFSWSGELDNAEILFYFTDGAVSGAFCNVRPGKVYTSR